MLERKVKRMVAVSFIGGLALAGCAEHASLPGTYTGNLTISNSGTWMGPTAADGTAEVKSFAGGSSTTDAKVVVRSLGEKNGRPHFEVDLNGSCTIEVRYDDGGSLQSAMGGPWECTCSFDQPVKGAATLLGSYRDGALSLNVSVGATQQGYGGGCSSTFTSHAKS